MLLEYYFTTIPKSFIALATELLVRIHLKTSFQITYFYHISKFLIQCLYLTEEVFICCKDAKYAVICQKKSYLRKSGNRQLRFRNLTRWVIKSILCSKTLSLSFSIFFLFLTSLSILNFLSLPLSLSLSFLCIFICFSYQ